MVAEQKFAQRSLDELRERSRTLRERALAQQQRSAAILARSEAICARFRLGDWMPRSGDVIFSLTDGSVSASWPGTNGSITLGCHQSVSSAMRDFLKQDEFGEQLASYATALKQG